MDPDVMQTIINSCELFKDLDQRHLDLLIVKASFREFSSGDAVYQKGEQAGGTFALIGSGRINVIAENGFILKELGAGEIIGEVGTVSQHGQRTVTLAAIEPTEILEWHIQYIEESSPELIKKLKDLAWKRIKDWYE